MGIASLIGCALAPLPMPSQAGEHASGADTRIAAISGVHEPHQGFALSDTVPSDKLCIELAQNLASELGIPVHVVCTDARTGRPTVVAECGYADQPDSQEVGSYTRSWIGEGPYLICVPRPRDRFRARRVAPDLDALRP